jgi:pyruvate/2-oxoglutarate/acetoin dehydrogenase E1 component
MDTPLSDRPMGAAIGAAACGASDRRVMFIDFMGVCRQIFNQAANSNTCSAASPNAGVIRTMVADPRGRPAFADCPDLHPHSD